MIGYPYPVYCSWIVRLVSSPFHLSFYICYNLRSASKLSFNSTPRALEPGPVLDNDSQIIIVNDSFKKPTIQAYSKEISGDKS